MEPGEAVARCLSRPLDLGGRAPLGELWWFALAVTMAALVALALDRALFPSGRLVLVWFTAGALAVPLASAIVRRLHDTGRSGLWALLALVPFLGVPLLAALCVFESELGRNRYGPDPLEGEAPARTWPDDRLRSVVEWGERR